MPRFVQTTGSWVISAPAEPLKHALLACALSIVTACSTPAPGTTTTLDIGDGTRVHVPVTFSSGAAISGSCAASFRLLLRGRGPCDLADFRRGRSSVGEGDHEAALCRPSEDQEALREKEGFSLLDLQRVAQRRGHKAQGFRLAPEFLPKLQGPVIAFIRPRGYEHFAVLTSHWSKRSTRYSCLAISVTGIHSVGISMTWRCWNPKTR